MKATKKVFMVLMVLGFLVPSINAQEVEAKVKVYYFHNTKRCETCKAIENEAKNALIENYPTQMEDGLVTFESFNFDDNKNSELIRELKVEGQSLFVIKNGKKTDLTEKGMIYARLNAEKFKKIVTDTVGKL